MYILRDRQPCKIQLTASNRTREGRGTEKKWTSGAAFSPRLQTERYQSRKQLHLLHKQCLSCFFFVVVLRAGPWERTGVTTLVTLREKISLKYLQNRKSVYLVLFTWIRFSCKRGKSLIIMKFVQNDASFQCY